MPTEALLLNSTAGMAAQIVLLLAALVLGVRKLYMLWGKDSVSISEDRARKNIVEQLHEELTRISEQRLLVADQLLKLQLNTNELIRQIGLLTSEVSVLTHENASLKSEVQQLRSEVARLRLVKCDESGAYGPL